MSTKQFRIGKIFSLIFFYSTVLAAADTSSSFSRAERCFADSQYFSAIDAYREYINGKRYRFGQAVDDGAIAFFNIGLGFYRTGNFLSAATAFEEYARLYPADKHFGDALLYCANAYAGCGDFKNASELWYRVWMRGIAAADRQTPLFEAARCADRDNNEDRAAAIYTEFLQKFPADPKALEAAPRCALLLIKQKKFYLAAALLDGAEKKWPKDDSLVTRLLYVKALLAKARLKKDNALRFFSALLNRSDDFPEKDRALSEYAAMLTEDRQYKTLALVYKKMADAQLRKGQATASWDFMITWAQCYRNAGNFDAAEKLYRQMQEGFTASVRAAEMTYEIAQCQLSRKDSAAALASFQELMAGSGPDSLRAKAALLAGAVCCGEGLFPQAVAAFRTYCTIPGSRSSDSIQYIIARIYQRTGLLVTAIQEFERLLRLYPQSSWYFHAALSAGQCEEALSHFQSALDRYTYVAESGYERGIVEQAKKLRDNVVRFGVVCADAAIVDLERIAHTAADSMVSPVERLIRLARIFDVALHDYPAALDLYDQAARLTPASADSIRAQIMFCKGTVLENMYQKARFDRDSAQASGLKTKAMTLLQEAARFQRFPSIVDDALYHLLMVGGGGIADFERYCARTSGSDHVYEALLYIGDYYQRRLGDTAGKPARKAIDAYTRIIRCAADGFRCRALLALSQTWYSTDNFDSAAHTIDECNRLCPDSAGGAQRAYFAALIGKKLGKFSSAIALLHRIIADHPFSDLAQSARFELASAHDALGSYPEALREYRVYLQSYPNAEHSAEARLGVARCQVRTGKSDEAVLSLLEMSKQTWPAALTGGIDFELALYYIGKGETRTALDYLQKAVSMDSFPDKSAAYARMGSYYFESGLYEEAAGSYGRVLRIGGASESDSITALIGMIAALIMDGQTAPAEKFETLFKKRFGARNQRYGEVVYYEGLRDIVEKQYESAIKKLKIVADTYPGSPYCDDAAYQIGLCYYYMGKTEKAFEVFHDCIAQYPGSSFAAMALFKIGMMLHDRGDLALAAQSFEKVAFATAGDGKTRFRAAYNAAIDYQKSASWLDAARLYRIIIDSFPQEISAPSTNLKIGFCYIQASHFEDALKYFQKAFSGASADEKPEIVYWSAQCLARLGDIQKAIAEYLKVPAQFSTIGQWATTAQFEAARLYERTGEMKKAFALYKKIVARDGELGVFGKEALAQCTRLTPFIKDN